MGISLWWFGEVFLFSSGVGNMAAGRGELLIAGGFWEFSGGTVIKGCWELLVRFVDGGRVVVGFVNRLLAGEKVRWGLNTQRVGFCRERGWSCTWLGWNLVPGARSRTMRVILALSWEIRIFWIAPAYSFWVRTLPSLVLGKSRTKRGGWIR